jgi:hypothetical protein
MLRRVRHSSASSLWQAVQRVQCKVVSDETGRLAAPCMSRDSQPHMCRSLIGASEAAFTVCTLPGLIHPRSILRQEGAVFMSAPMVAMSLKSL